MKKKHKELHEAKTHPNSLQPSSQTAEQTSVTARARVMVFALTKVAVCLAFIYHGWWSAVADGRACLGVILMLVVGRPVVALFHPRPGASRRCSFGWICWPMAMSAWIMAVAMVHPRGGCRLLGRMREH